MSDAVRNSQREFSALALDADGAAPHLTRFGLEAAEEDGTLFHVGSTYSPENDAVYDGTSRPGTRLVTFAPILKNRLFPLPEILNELLAMSVAGASTEVELEFAADLTGGRDRREFAVLQLRPVARSGDLVGLGRADVDPAEVVCQGPSVLGHGRVTDILDVVVVDFHRFDRGRSQDVARAVARFNAELKKRGRPYVLVGVGRWGHASRCSGSRDVGPDCRRPRDRRGRLPRLPGRAVAGAMHFFQNLTSTGTAFAVNQEAGRDSSTGSGWSRSSAAATAGCVDGCGSRRPSSRWVAQQGVIRKPR